MKEEETRYIEPEEVGYQDAIRVFKTGNPNEIARVLLGLALKGQDPEYALQWSLFFLGHNNDIIAGAAAVCIGHLARIHRQINIAVTVPALQIVKNKGRIEGQAEDALEDIAQFCSPWTDKGTDKGSGVFKRE